MTMELYMMLLLGFFAGLSSGLIVTVVLTVSWVKSMQARMVSDTVAEIMEELGMDDRVASDDDDGQEGVSDPDDLHEEWWKRGKK